MRKITTHKDADNSIFLRALNEARCDERKNQAVYMSSRLESMAAYIIQREMNGKEAAEALRTEAVRISNEALEVQ